MKYVQVRQTGEIVAVETSDQNVARVTAAEWVLGRPLKNGSEAFELVQAYAMTVLTPATGIGVRRV